MYANGFESHDFLKFHVKLLKFVRLWPRQNEKDENWWKVIQNYLLIIVLIPNSIPAATDVLLIVNEPDADISLMIQPLLATICLFGQHYIVVCFLRNKLGIKKLIESVGDFQKYSPLEEMIVMDKKATFMAKLMMLYSTLGALLYSILPLFNLKNCEETRTKSMKDNGIPCGMVCRVRPPFKYDYSPMYEFMYGHQIFLVFVCSWVMIMMTMLIYGLVLQATHHMKVLREKLLELSNSEGEIIEEKIRFCVHYHTAIIDFCDEINDCFGSQMFIHVSITSLIISILGFELLTVQFFDAIRFLVHLFGWIFMLLTVCYIGQTLMDESIEVANVAYNTKWYTFSIASQMDLRMIVMRAQKPVILRALNVGFLSFATFLKVMSTAYSYLTLLFNIK